MGLASYKIGIDKRVENAIKTFTRHPMLCSTVSLSYSWSLC